MEGYIASYKNILDFFTDRCFKVWWAWHIGSIGAIGHQKFISHWSSSLYVYVSTLKKYTKDILGAIRAHHCDIVNGGRRILENIKGIENNTYSLKGWLWRSNVKKHVKWSEKQRAIYIMHRRNLFTCGDGQLGKQTLWVVDCRWGSTTRMDKTWSKKIYKNAI